MNYCNHGTNANDPCPDCIREQNGRPKPDRAARIRALAERAIERYEGTNNGPTWPIGAAFDWARGVIDELDRLEEQEREKGKP